MSGHATRAATADAKNAAEIELQVAERVAERVAAALADNSADKEAELERKIEFLERLYTNRGYEGVTYKRVNLQKVGVSIPKLKSAANWPAWSIDMEAVLNAADLASITTGDEVLPENPSAWEKETWRLKNRDGSLLLFQAVVEELRTDLVKIDDDGRENWKRLAEFGHPSEGTKLRILREFYNAEMNEDGNVEKHISKMEKLRRQAVLVGHAPDSAMYGSIIERSLTETWRKNVLRLRNKQGNYDPDALKGTLRHGRIQGPRKRRQWARR